MLQVNAQVYTSTPEHPQDVKEHDAASTCRHADEAEPRAEEGGEGEGGRQKGARGDSPRIVEMGSHVPGGEVTGMGGEVGKSVMEGPEQQPPSMSDDEKTEEEEEKDVGGEGVADAGASDEARKAPGGGVGWKDEDPEDFQIFSEDAKLRIVSERAKWGLQTNSDIGDIGASASTLPTSSTPVPASANPEPAAAASEEGGSGDVGALFSEAAGTGDVADYCGTAFKPRINHEFKAVKCV